MKFRIEPAMLPRYQAIAMVTVVLLSVLMVSGFFLFKSHLENTDRFSRLSEEAALQQRRRLRSEVDAVIERISQLRGEARYQLQTRAKEHVNQAWTVANSLYQQDQHTHSRSEIEALIVAALREIRFFSDRGYLFIYSLTGRAVLLPPRPDLEGSNLQSQLDDNGTPIMPALIEAINQSPQGGFASYRWYPPGESVMREKVSYIRRFEPYGWMIGGGDYMYRMEEDLKAMMLERLSTQKIGSLGRFSVISSSGKVLVSPTASALSGDRMREIASPEAQALVRQLLQVAAVGGGYMEYQQPGAGEGGESVLALVQLVPGWDWVLVASLYPEDIRMMIDEQSRSLSSTLADNSVNLIAAALLSGSAVLAIALLFARWLRRGFQQYQQDIDQQRRQLETSARVFEAAREGILITDPQNRILAVNQAFTAITGFSREEAIGCNPSFMSSGVHGSSFYDELWQVLEASGSWQGELWNRRKDGSLFPEWLSISVCRDEAGAVLNYIATITDLSERKRAEERIRYLAEYDPLTDLPNRFLLADRVNYTISSIRRSGGRLALIYLDLNRFKDINDVHGHAAGDQLLREIGQQLVSLVRASDTVARLGSDEFAILVSPPVNPDTIVSLVRRLSDGMELPLSQSDSGYSITPSVGVAVCPEDGDNFETLLRNAETALRHAKAGGRNNFRFFTAQMNERLAERLQLEADLRMALVRNEFELYYQPQIALSDERVVGCEALLRWQHPQRGLVAPADFVPLAEENGLIIPLGEWVIEQACRQAVEWAELGYPSISVAVNVSACQFRSDLIGTIRRILDKTGLSAGQLEVEVTETLLIDDLEQAQRVLAQLKQMGLRIALDDFGTGYSSLSYLKCFALDKLKIDQMFTAGLPDDADDSALTSSIIDIARNLQLETVAEGVETRAQQQFLAAAGCDLAQGYFYAQPLPAAEFSLLLQTAPLEPLA